jgi:hypothetical protein
MVLVKQAPSALKCTWGHYKSSAFWKDEFRSFLTTLASILAVDGALQLMAVYQGDFSKAAWIALAVAVVRSVVKTVFTLALPRAFPLRKS